MSMDHKAYAFDWHAFDAELRPILENALGGAGAEKLVRWMEANRIYLTDPYEGKPLPADWISGLESGGLQELADFALTRYYQPTDNCGLSTEWLSIDADLNKDAQDALLGFPIGPEDNRFDPGLMGSYFQTPDGVRKSLRELRGLELEPLAPMLELMERCSADSLGLYVTF